VRVLKLEKLLLFARWITLVTKSFRGEIQMVAERVHCFFQNPVTLFLMGIKMADSKRSYDSWHLIRPEDRLLHR